MQKRWEFKPQAWTATGPSSEADPRPSRPVWPFLIAGCALLAALAGVWLRCRSPIEGRTDDPKTVPDQPTQARAATIAEEALAVATLLVERFPNSPGSLNVMGWTRYSFGDSEAAMRCWEESLRLDPRSGLPYFCMGRLAVEQGDHQKAADLFRTSLSLDPNSRDARTRLAEALMQLDRAEEVVELLEAKGTTDLGSLEHLVLLGEAYLQLGEYGKAEERLRAYVKAAPTNREAQYLLATAFAKLGEKEKAAEYFKKVQRLYDTERRGRQVRHSLRGDDARGILASVYLLAGQVYYDRGIPAEAEAHWQKGKAADAADIKARRALVELYQRQGRTAEAIRVLEEMRQIQPENVSYCLELGAGHASLGQVDAAEAAFQATVDQAPDWPTGYVALVQLYLGFSRKLDKAVELAQTAVDLDPVASNYFLLSLASQRNGDFERSLAAIERAKELEPGNREYEKMHALIREKL